MAFTLVFHPAGGRQAVDLAVVIKALAADGNDDDHGFMAGWQTQAQVGVERTAAEIGPPDRQLVAAVLALETQAGVFVGKKAVALAAVARQFDAAGQRDGERFFMVVAAGKFDHVGKDRTQVANVADGEAEEVGGGGDRVIIPALDAQPLQETQPVEMGLIQVAIQQRLARPTNVGQVALCIQQRSGTFEHSLHVLLLKIRGGKRVR